MWAYIYLWINTVKSIIAGWNAQYHRCTDASTGALQTLRSCTKLLTQNAITQWPSRELLWCEHVISIMADETYACKCGQQSETYLALWLNMMRFLQQQKSSIVTTDQKNKGIHGSRQTGTGVLMYIMLDTIAIISCLNVATSSESIAFAMTKDLCLVV
jgi:hypothetical protein